MPSTSRFKGPILDADHFRLLRPVSERARTERRERLPVWLRRSSQAISRRVQRDARQGDIARFWPLAVGRAGCPPHASRWQEAPVPIRRQFLLKASAHCFTIAMTSVRSEATAGIGTKGVTAAAVISARIIFAFCLPFVWLPFSGRAASLCASTFSSAVIPDRRPCHARLIN